MISVEISKYFILTKAEQGLIYPFHYFIISWLARIVFLGYL